MAEDEVNSQFIRPRLWKELQSADLILNSESYRSCLATIFELGSQEHNRLLMEEGICKKEDNCLETPFSVNDLARILGFGRLLTEFTLAPVAEGVTPTEIEAVCKLGALANLIVTLYDHHVDLAPCDTAILSRQAIEDPSKVAYEDHNDFDQHDNGCASQSIIIRQLVTAYYRQLAELQRNETQSSLRNFINRVIVRMYDAEMATVRTSNARPDERILRRKSALPFVVLGLPIWLAMPEGRTSVFMQHLRWLYKLGEFIGWLDDAIDFDADRETGHANRINNALLQADDPQSKCEYLIRRIAWQGRQSENWWQSRVTVHKEARAPCADALSTVIVSWLGGLTSRPEANA